MNRKSNSPSFSSKFDFVIVGQTLVPVVAGKFKTLISSAKSAVGFVPRATKMILLGDKDQNGAVNVAVSTPVGYSMSVSNPSGQVIFNDINNDSVSTHFQSVTGKHKVTVERL